MRIVLCETYEEMSKTAAKLVKEQLAKKPDSILGFATGSTPIGTYQELADMCQRGEADFTNVRTFNLDEYYPILRDNDQSYYYFMNKHLYSKVNLKPENIHIPNGEAPDAAVECAGYDKEIEKLGGIDLQIVGIGGNGHIAFNEPDEELDAATHVTGLTEDTIQANSRFFASADDVPRHALTMGMASIMKAKKIVFLANGAGKRDAMQKLLSGKITTMCPASMLHMHPDVTVIADKEAMGE